MLAEIFATESRCLHTSTSPALTAPRDAGQHESERPHTGSACRGNNQTTRPSSSPGWPGRAIFDVQTSSSDQPGPFKQFNSPHTVSSSACCNLVNTCSHHHRRMSRAQQSASANIPTLVELRFSGMRATNEHKRHRHKQVSTRLKNAASQQLVKEKQHPTQSMPRWHKQLSVKFTEINMRFGHKRTRSPIHHSRCC